QSRGGNSGSALVDVDGRVRAILQGGVIRSIPPSLRILMTEPERPLSIGTTLACVSIPGHGPSELPAGCEGTLTPDESVKQIEAILAEGGAALDQLIHDETLEWQEAQNAKIQWEYRSRPKGSYSKTRMLARPEPVCFRNPQSWIGSLSTSYTGTTTVPFT